jgi:DNA-binding LacI/PurR family transcriptional regulator
MVSRDPDHPISMTQIAAWRSACAYDENEFRRRLIRVESDSVALRMQHAHKAVSRYLTSHKTEVTAIIGLDDEVMLGTLAACHDAAHPVPQNMSLVNIGDSPLLQFARPFGLTAIDVQMQKHIEESLQMVEAALASTLSPQDRLRLIKPCLAERDSVRFPGLG